MIRAKPVARISRGGGTARFTLPAGASDYRYIDISEEKPGGFPGHSGRSVERVTQLPQGRHLPLLVEAELLHTAQQRKAGDAQDFGGLSLFAPGHA